MTSSPDLLESAKGYIVSQWQVLSDAKATYEALTWSPLKLSENHTWCISVSNDDVELKWVLRLTPLHHRSLQSVVSELSFVSFVRKHSGAHVCAALERIPERVSGDGGPAVVAPALQAYASDGDDVRWMAALFPHARGSHVLGDGSTTLFAVLWDYDVVREWGATFGRLHSATAAAEPPLHEREELRAIPHWTETHGGAMKRDRIKELAQASPALGRAWEHMWQFLDALEPTKETWGVCHGDLNHSNFFKEVKPEGDICLHVFDFDQSQRNFFAADVSTPLYAATHYARVGWNGQKLDRIDPERFQRVFLEGYRAHNGSALDAHLQHVSEWIQWRSLYQITISYDLLHKVDHAALDLSAPIVDFMRGIVAQFEKDQQE